MTERTPRESRETSIESESENYRKALDAARTLFAAGIPYNDERRGVQAALDVIAAWEQSRDLHIRGIGTLAKARDIKRASMLWIDAGYKTLEAVQAAMTRLQDEYADALREGNPEIATFLREALEEVEAILITIDPREKKSTKLARKREEAERFVQQGKIRHAVAVLGLLLIDPSFKRMSDQERSEITARLEELKEKMPPP